MAVTIYDVARKAKVSAATVSRVLNNQPTVDARLAAAVRTAVAELDYRRNAVAGNLRLNKTSLLAVIISDISNPFFTSVVRGIEDVAQETSYSVVLCNSDEDPAKEAEYLRVVVAERMAGVIISAARGGKSGLTDLATSAVPVVAIDREVVGVATDVVVVDNRSGAKAAVSHLVGAGYERVACITGPHNVSTATERLKGYEQALREARRPVVRELIERVDFREAGGYAAMTRLLQVSPAPDAVFVANNLMTIGALRCLSDHRLKISQDVGVVGFDDVQWAELVDPRLTTVAQPTLEVGRTAARMLVSRIATPGLAPRKTVLSTTLVVRDSSSRTLAGAGPAVRQAR